MRSTEETPEAPEAGIDGASPGARHPARRRTAVIAAISVALAATVAGASVFAWEQGRIRDPNVALAAALTERDAARSATQALQVDVEKLGAKVGRLRSQVQDLEQQLAVPAAAACDPAAMLPVIQDSIELGVEGVFWDEVGIQECRNGYARVYAGVGGTPPPGTSLEDAEQVFLKDVDGEWTVLTSGTGIGCADDDLSPELQLACNALGLP
jgi:hypothetical protein